MTLDVGLRPATVTAGIDAVALAEPSRPALDGAGEIVTFGRLAELSAEAAGRLARAGVTAGALVALELDRSVDAVACVLGLWTLGAGYVPLDPRWPEPYRQALTATVARHVVRANGEGWDVVETGHTPAPPVAPPDDSVAYGILTSGTSGRRRCVVVGQQSLAALAEGLRRTVYADVDGSRLRIAMQGPMSFDTSVKQLVQLASGHTVVLVPEAARTTPSALAEHLARHRVDVVDLTPSAVRRWLSDGVLGGDAPAPVSRLLLGGEAVDESLWVELGALEDVKVVNLYGPTECTVDTTWAPVAGTSPRIGHPLPGIEVTIEDRAGHAVPDFVVGELVVRGRSVAWGYLDGEPGGFRLDPDAPRSYATGDRARRRRDGALEFIGRLDTQTKLHGVRVDLAEVEANLQALAGVAAAGAAVTAAGSLVAAVVLDTASPGEASDARALRAALLERVPMAQVPAEIQVVDALTLTERGKLDRAAIAELAVDLGGPARPGIESMMAEAMASLVGGPPLERHESFLRRGGDSLGLLELCSLVADELGCEVEVMAVAAAPTPAALADLVADLGLDRDTAPTPASTPASIPDVAAARTSTTVMARSLGDAIAAGRLAPVDAIAITCVPDLARTVFGTGEQLRAAMGDLPALAAVRDHPHGRLGFVLVPCYASEAATRGTALIDAAMRMGATFGARAASLTGQLAPATDHGRALPARIAGVTLTSGQGSTVATMVEAWLAACAARRRDPGAERVVLVGGGSLTEAFAATVAAEPNAPRLVHLDTAPDALETATSVVVAGVAMTSVDLGRLADGAFIVEYGTGFADALGPGIAAPVVSGGSIVLSAPTDDVVHLPPELLALGPELAARALELDPARIAACALAALLVAQAAVPAVIGPPTSVDVAVYRAALRRLGFRSDVATVDTGHDEDG